MKEFKTTLYVNGISIISKNARVFIECDGEYVHFQSKRLVSKEDRNIIFEMLSEDMMFKRQKMSCRGWVLHSNMCFSADLFKEFSIAYLEWLEWKKKNFETTMVYTKEVELPEGFTEENTIIKTFTGTFNFNKNEDI